MPGSERPNSASGGFAPNNLAPIHLTIWHRDRWRSGRSYVPKVCQVQDAVRLVDPDDHKRRIDDRPAVHRRPCGESKPWQFVEGPVGELGKAGKQSLPVLIAPALRPPVEAALRIGNSPRHAAVLRKADSLAAARLSSHGAQLVHSAGVLPVCVSRR